MKQAVVIGDALWDAVVSSPGAAPHLYPGGAGLNLTVGLARFGFKSALAARVGHDAVGARLRRHMAERGVELIETPNTDFTEVVTSTRENGEPSYYFPPQLYRRRIHFGAKLAERVEGAAALAMNSFPYADPKLVERVTGLLRKAPGLTAVDPNPRPRLIRDLDQHRKGVEAVMSSVQLVKLSSEDAALLYPGGEAEAIARIFELGPRAVVYTRGADGASAFTRDNRRVDVPIASAPGPIVDTMGAGDATFATVIASIVHDGFPQDTRAWEALLNRAMRVAAATCRSPGGEVVVPPDSVAT